jgi:DNA-binding transcriptional regulator YiaG
MTTLTRTQLRALRRQLGLTQAAMAHTLRHALAIPVSLSTYQHWEQGHRGIDPWKQDVIRRCLETLLKAKQDQRS